MNKITPISENGLIGLEKIERLEHEMLKQKQVDCPVVHHFSPGIYMREVTIPAGTLAIGHYQKREHLNIFLKGRVTVLNDDGTTSELIAPMTFTGQPGRKVGYIHEDMVWLNVYPTTETDVEILEKTYLDKSNTWNENKAIMEGIENIQAQIDRNDYLKVLIEFGFTEDVARSQSEDESDQIPMLSGSFKIAIANSQIEGKGVFATSPIDIGEVIGPARLSGKRTPIGRYVNHSVTPNAKMVREGGDIYLVSIAAISGCVGGDLGKEITTDYRNNLQLAGAKSCQA